MAINKTGFLMLTLFLNLLKVSDDKQVNKKKEVTYYKCKEKGTYPSSNTQIENRMQYIVLA